MCSWKVRPWLPSDMLKFLMACSQTFLGAFSNDWEPKNGKRERPSYGGGVGSVGIAVSCIFFCSGPKNQSRVTLDRRHRLMLRI